MFSRTKSPQLRSARHETILAAVLIAEIVIFHLLGPRFATRDNAFDILRHSVEIGLLSIAITPIILMGAIDLSVGSLLGLCAIVFGKLWRDGGLPPFAAALCTIAAGALAGAINGTLVTRLRMPSLIITLGTYSLFRGLAEAVTRGVDTFTGFPRTLLFLGQKEWLGLPAQLPAFLAVIVVIWLLVHRTTFGRACRAIGFSPEGARFAGLPVTRHTILAFMLAGTVSALAAIIYTARVGQAKADAGAGYELFAITAVVLGGTSIFGGVGSVHGTLLGVAAIAVLNNGLVHARYPREIAGMLTGALLIMALIASTLPKFLRRPGGGGDAASTSPNLSSSS
ncbi:MAG TPA: ABC transporter permease [Chthoniobacteraceae bacterium]|nr:ABC transporter permease [Chthoniobacteraceae bacterium]